MTTTQIIEESKRRRDIRTFLINRRRHDYVGEVRERVAPVRDNLEWYHVDAEDRPLYNRRFKFASPVSDGIATVQDKLGYFHIYIDGTDVYSERSSFINNVLLSKYKNREQTGVDINGLLATFVARDNQ